MEESFRKGLANHPGPESCMASREAANPRPLTDQVQHHRLLARVHTGRLDALRLDRLSVAPRSQNYVGHLVIDPAFAALRP